MFHVHKQKVSILSTGHFFPTWSTDLMQSQSNFMDINKLILKLIWRDKRFRIVNTILKLKKKVEGWHYPLQAIVIKTLWYWWKNRQIDKWNRTETKIDPRVKSQLIFDKGAKTIQWNKDSLFNKWCWNNWISPCKKMNLAIDLHKN